MQLLSHVKYTIFCALKLLSNFLLDIEIKNTLIIYATCSKQPKLLLIWGYSVVPSTLCHFSSLSASLLASISTDKFILFMHFMYVLNSFLIALPIQKIAEIA